MIDEGHGRSASIKALTPRSSSMSRHGAALAVFSSRIIRSRLVWAAARSSC